MRTGRPRVAITAGPNPFRGSLLITLDHLSAGALGHSRVCVFDASGRRVRTLEVDRESRAVWDGADGSGHDLPAGAYFAVVDGGAARATTCLVLLR
jgi:hypothetical protein